MNPILFKANSTSFNTNGVGRLTPISCTVTEERNSIFELDMTVKIGCNHFEDIKQSAIVTAKPSPGRSPQPFRIYYVSRPIDGKVKIKAEHLSYWLNYIPVMPFSTVNGVQNALNGFKINATESCPFTFWTDIVSSSSYAVPVPESIRHYLGGVRGSILDVFGGEYEWDNYAVKLHKARGVMRDVTLRYGKNIIDLKQEENISNTFTGICPYWNSTEGQLVTLPEKVIHSVNANNFPFQRTIAKNFSDVFDNAPTIAQLRAHAQNYVRASGVGVPKVSVDVSFVDLAQTEEYKELLALQEVELCDTIKVEFLKLGVSTTEKITKTVYDVLNERYTKIGIGDVRSSLAKTIEEQIDTVSYVPTATEVQRDIDRATGVLNQGKMGHMAVNRNTEGYSNELLFLDEQSGGNLYTAKNILRINMAGIGFSSNGYLGPYAQAWTLDGRLSLGGVNNSHGNLIILDSSGNVIGKWDKDGIYANGGELRIGSNFYVDRNGNLRANNGAFVGGTISIGSKFQVDADGTLHAASGKFTGDIESGSTITGAKIRGSEIGTKNDEFYVVENGERVEIGFSGFDCWDNVLRTNWLGNVENPATGGDDAGINGRNGDAGFRRLFLLDGWYEGSDGSMWDVTRTIRWLDNRLRSIEAFCQSHDWSGDEGGDDGDDPGGDDYLPDGPVG